MAQDYTDYQGEAVSSFRAACSSKSQAFFTASAKGFTPKNFMIVFACFLSTAELFPFFFASCAMVLNVAADLTMRRMSSVRAS